MHGGIFGPTWFRATDKESMTALGSAMPVPMTCAMVTPVVRPERLMMYLDAAVPQSYPGAGVTWFDLSGRGNHATLVNGPVFLNENGGVMFFDGTNDYARVLNSASLNMGAGSWTSEFWVKVPTYTTAERILFEYGPYPNSGMYQFTSYGTGIMPTLRTNTLAANTAGKALDYNFPPLTTNTWLHLAGQLDADKDCFRIFVNGLLVAQNSGVTQDNVSITRSMYVFSRGGGSLFLPNRCGAVLIYNIALSQEEVRHNYNRFRVRYL